MLVKRKLMIIYSIDILLRSVKNDDKISKIGNKNMNFQIVKTRINRLFDNVFTYED